VDVTEPADRRLLLVHAHPDDETIGTGATMAHYVASGARVTLVTCTLGEEGEVLVPALRLLASEEADQLGGWRIAELNRAMAELGITDHRFLGGAGRFRDSGMMGTAANANPRAFWRAAQDRAVFDAAVAALVEVIREVRPQVTVSYDDFGGYGHPDHLMAHRVATAAAAAAAQPEFPVAGPPWTVSKFYWTAAPRSVLQRQLAALRAAPDVPFEVPGSADDLGFAVDDELVTTVVQAPDQLAAKSRALAAHATQITVAGPFFALSNNRGQQVSATEYFRLVHGKPGGPRDADGRETDLFGGLCEPGPA
jgi:N-acetyl-1-D-myo-inositol-2-amino-2-deoxy-alpha-D-glucopyranoside deacetylase